MLGLSNVSYTIAKDGEETDLLHEVTFAVPRSHFMAVVGLSGCGKTTLLKIIAGIHEETGGALFWDGRNLAEDNALDTRDVGYVPQFSVAYEHLSVEENVDSAVRLRVETANAAEAEEIADRAIAHAGLTEIAERRARVLSGGEKRRLGLALELVSDPKLLLCDEVTSGLDPRGERDIVSRLHQLAKDDGRIAINVTHSLSHLELYDSVLVMHEGCVVYHGPPSCLEHYFSVKNAEDIYLVLADRNAVRWHHSWKKHRGAYYRAMKIPEPVAQGDPAKIVASKPDDESALGMPPMAEGETEPEPAVPSPVLPTDAPEERRLPGVWSQLAVLLRRRFRVFVRDRVHLFLHIAILLGFPLLVVLFTPGFLESNVGMGIPPMPNQLSVSETVTQSDLERQAGVLREQFRLGVLISALIMIQVILLAIIGANNSAREIVAERGIFEKEKLAGLSPFAYILSKVFFLGFLCLAQSAWMALFVSHFTNMPGSFAVQFALLFLVNAAVTAVCLGVSAWMRSTEQSSLMSIYLVGFQLPLSGAVLPLPEKLEGVIRPLVAGYWSWAGQVHDIKTATDYDRGITQAVKTTLAEFPTCAGILLLHVAVGIFLAYQGSRRHVWE